MCVTSGGAHLRDLAPGQNVAAVATLFPFRPVRESTQGQGIFISCGVAYNDTGHEVQVYSRPDAKGGKPFI